MQNLKLKKIHKSFFKNSGLKIFHERVHILNDIDLVVNEKEILGLIGRNGAGKSTLIKIVAGLILPDSGEIDVKTKKIALINTNPRSFYWRLSCIDNLKFFGGLSRIESSRIESSIQKYTNFFKLENILESPFRFLSSGQMQLMSLIRSLITEPKILLLDEPTINLDYEYKKSYVSVVQDYIESNNASAIWCSHDFDEIESVADKIGILNKMEFNLIEKEKYRLFFHASSKYKIEIDKNELNKIDAMNISYKKLTDLKHKKTIYINFHQNNENISLFLKRIHNKNIKIFSVVRINHNIFNDFIN